jgi:Fur family transcriptional regulator, ferric uptake regulator
MRPGVYGRATPDAYNRRMPLEPLPRIDEDALEIVEPLCAVFRRKLKSEGLKYTPERAQVLDAIVRMDGLFEAEGLLAALRTGDQRVSKATVYRTIRLLQDAGIVQRILFDEDHAHYQLVYGRRPNDLLIRLDSRRAEEIHIPELVSLVDRVCRARGLEPRGHRLQIFAVRNQTEP